MPIKIDARTRSERGRHVHPLRREGMVPAVVYGHNVEPQALVADAKLLERAWQRAGRTQLVDLAIDGHRPRKVLVREFQISPRTGRPMHADFFAVNLREKLTADVPVMLVGEAPAVSDQKIGTLQQVMTSLKVECLPADLPGQFNVDVSGLDAIDAGVHVRDIEVPQGVALVHIDPDELVVKVAALRVSLEEEEAAAAEEAAEEGAPTAEGAETPAAETE